MKRLKRWKVGWGMANNKVKYSKAFYSSFRLIMLLISLCIITTACALETVSNKSIPLSAEELAAFEDTPNLFPIKKLPDVGVEFKGFAWFNDNTAITGLDHYGQWTAAHTELPKISLLNIDTGEIKETVYRGRLICYRPEQMAVCPHYLFGCSETLKQTRAEKGTTLVVGKYGEYLQPRDKPTAVLINKNTCEDQVFDDNNPNVSNNFRLGTLGQDAGYIGYSRSFILAGTGEIKLLDNNYKQYWQTTLFNGCEWTAPIVFHPWDKTYLIGNNFYQSSAQSSGNCATHHRILLVHPNQSAQEILVPDLFEIWLKQHLAGINIAMTREGMLVYSKPAGEPNRLGLFWVNKQGEIKRLIANRLVEFLSVAPDGCHVLIQHHETNLVMVGMPATDADRRRIVRTFETSVINMCKGKE